MTYDVERVVIGGGVSHAGDPFAAPLRRELARLRAASPTRRRSCCRPTSSRSCRPRPRPAHGAPSPSRGPRSLGPRPRDRRWCATPELISRSHVDRATTEAPRPPSETRSTREGAPRRSDGHQDQAPSRVTAAACCSSSRLRHRRQTAPSGCADARRRAPNRAHLPSTAAESAAPTALAADPAEAVIPDVEPGAVDRRLDVLAVADVRPVHRGHDRPLRGDLSGRQGQVGRPPGHVPG